MGGRWPDGTEHLACQLDPPPPRCRHARLSWQEGSRLTLLDVAMSFCSSLEDVMMGTLQKGS